MPNATPRSFRDRSFAFLRSRRVLGWTQLGASVLVLSLTLAAIDVERLPERLASARAPWLFAGAAIVALQIALMGTRWWYLAHRLGVGLSYRHAVAEYGLSTLLNQVLPGGVAGDAVRAVRHHRGVERDAPVERAGTRVVMTLVLDRLSGQLALWAVVVATAPGWWRAAALEPRQSLLVLGLPLAAGVALGVGWVATRRAGFRDAVRQVWNEGGRAAFTRATWLVHLGISVALVGLHVLVFWSVATALGIELELGVLFRVVPLLLLVSSIPAFFAGWGVREATAAALFQLSRLPASDGTSLSLVYGLVALAGSLPGLLALRPRAWIRE